VSAVEVSDVGDIEAVHEFRKFANGVSVSK
jgi:hypothetical protein